MSSDRDFFPLVNRLRSSGKTVVIAGRSAATSDVMKDSCDLFIPLDEGIPVLSKNDESAERQPAEKPPSTASDDQASTEHGRGRSPARLLRLAMDDSMDEQGNVKGGRLYDTMRRIDPSFDFKKLGYSTFTEFLVSRHNVVKVTRPEGPGDVTIQLFQK